MMKMFSSENNGLFPAGQQWNIGGFGWQLGVNGMGNFHNEIWPADKGVLGNDGLYPEYWTDVNIMICPSDSRSTDLHWIGDIGIEEDVQAQLDKITGSDWPSKAIRNSILSQPVSYIYMPYATKTTSQMLDAAFIVANWALGKPGGGNYSDVNGVARIAVVHSPDIVSRGGPSQWNIVAYWANRGAVDLPGTHPASPRGGWRDDDGSPLPGSYPRLKEGIERFFITDINNPAASAVGQSGLPVMWDAWSTSGHLHAQLFDVDKGAAARFNHIPGGSNVLYMDGHVEFVRYQAKFPIESQVHDPAKMNLASQMAAWSNLMGGAG